MMKCIIVGTGVVAKAVARAIQKTNAVEIVAFSVEAAFMKGPQFLGKPVIPFENITHHFPPSAFFMMVAVAYEDCNGLRKRLYETGKAQGYPFLSYVHPSAAISESVEIGENSFIFENATCQDNVKIGNNVVIWSHAVVGHDTLVDDHVWLNAGAVICGNTRIQSNCYIGPHASIGHNLVVGENNVIGLGARITKNTAPNSVFIEKDTAKYPLDTKHFLALTAHNQQGL